MDNTLTIRHQVLPSNGKTNAQYQPFDNVDFSLDFNGRAILMNSIKLTGKLSVRRSNSKLDPTDNDDTLVFFDENIGAHNFIDTVSCSTQNQGQLETIQEYARYIGMKSDTTMYKTTQGGNLSNALELKTYSNRIANGLLTYRESWSGSGNNANVDDDLSFSIKPDILFNNVVGGENLDDVSVSYRKTGYLGLSFRLSRVEDALYGLGMGAQVDYTLDDLKVEFLSVPDSNPENNVMAEVKQHVKQTILSEQSNLSVRVPMVAKSFSASFLPSNQINPTEYNSHRRSAINDLRNLQFLFNNNTMELVTYDINNRNEVLRHYLKSMSSGTKNQLAPSSNSSLKGYGIGLSFEPMDLTNNSFNVNLEAETFVNQSHVLYGYFKGIVEL